MWGGAFFGSFRQTDITDASKPRSAVTVTYVKPHLAHICLSEIPPSLIGVGRLENISTDFSKGIGMGVSMDMGIGIGIGIERKGKCYHS